MSSTVRAPAAARGREYPTPICFESRSQRALNQQLHHSTGSSKLARATAFPPPCLPLPAAFAFLNEDFSPKLLEWNDEELIAELQVRLTYKPTYGAQHLGGREQ